MLGRGRWLEKAWSDPDTTIKSPAWRSLAARVYQRFATSGCHPARRLRGTDDFHNDTGLQRRKEPAYPVREAPGGAPALRAELGNRSRQRRQQGPERGGAR